MALFGKELNIYAECKELRWGLWQCPPFLFLLMGLITIISMIATYVLASRFIEQPEIAALLVIFVTVLFLIIGNIIVTGFNKIAEANRMKSEFISIVSHQLRSPLAIFKWTLDVLDRNSKNPETDMQQNKNFIQTLRATAEGMITLVNSLLEVSRIEARTFVLRIEIFSLEELTKKIVSEFSRYAEASNLAISVSAEPELPSTEADKERVGMVIQNLLDNAMRYTARASAITIKIAKKENTTHWSISDEGIGIPLNQQKFIFQKFFRAGNLKQTGNNSQTHGSGIGLYIAKEIVQASGGTIGFTSKEGYGTTFWFTLPVAKATGHT